MKIAASVRALILSCLLAPLAAAQGSFDGCGTIIQGTPCRLFQPDSGGGPWILNWDLNPYNVGDHLHVVGTTDPGCASICMQGSGCINPTVVEFCSPATDLCFGDGSSGNCPCSNNGVAGHGCENSIATGGALLTITGSTSPDTIVMTSSGERATSVSIFLQGDVVLSPPVTFGDGLRCAGGTLKRLYTKNAVGGVVTAPQGAEPSVSARSAALGDPIAPGTSRYYVTYYRDGSPTFCPTPVGNTFNSTNGKAILW